MNPLLNPADYDDGLQQLETLQKENEGKTDSRENRSAARINDRRDACDAADLALKLCLSA